MHHGKLYFKITQCKKCTFSGQFFFIRNRYNITIVKIALNTLVPGVHCPLTKMSSGLKT